MNLSAETTILPSKIGCMLINGAIGDQYGAPIEMMTRPQILSKYTQEQLHTYITTQKIAQREKSYTDDTQLTIGTLCAIHDQEQKKQGIDKYCFLRSYLKTFEPSRGYSLAMYNDFYDYILADFDCQNSEEIDKIVKVQYCTLNGGLLRVAPLIILLIQQNDKSQNTIRKYVEMIHYPTHMSNEAIEISVFYIGFLLKISDSKMDDIELTSGYLLTQLRIMLKDYSGKNLLNTINILLNYFDNGGKYYDKNKMNENDSMLFEKTIDDLVGLDAVESFETLGLALFGVLYSFNFPKETIFNTLQFGGDTDTVCAIAGQISGLIFGINAIDTQCLQNLEKSCFKYFAPYLNF